ncbi:MAG: hypothetical protein Q4C42_00440 [Clostridia bacterium]|nr:hypothetical protein [Clostridia bacterium]
MKRLINYTIVISAMFFIIVFTFSISDPVNIPDPGNNFIDVDTNGNTERAFSAVYYAMDNLEPGIVIYNPGNIKDYCKYTSDFYTACDYRIFWCDDYKWTSYTEEDKIMFKFSYCVNSKDELKEMQNEADSEKNAILSKIPAGASTWESAKIIHDELISLIKFEGTYTEDHIYNLYGALVNKSAACTGYAYAFSNLMNELGYNTYVVRSPEHAWNVVSTENGDLHIDCTWDDPDTYDSNGNPHIKYTYFFLGKDEICDVEQHGITGINNSGDASSLAKSWNYHKMQGFFLEEYDYDAVLNIFRDQYLNGDKVLTVKFANHENVENLEEWTENRFRKMKEALESIEYFGSFTWQSEPETGTFNIFLK